MRLCKRQKKKDERNIKYEINRKNEEIDIIEITLCISSYFFFNKFFLGCSLANNRFKS